MKKKSLKQLAEEMEIEVDTLLQEFSDNLQVLYSSMYKTLTSNAQNQVLNYCIEADKLDAYNYYFQFIKEPIQ